MQKVFACIRHVNLLVGSSILEFMPDLLQLEEHCFGFIGYRSSE